jgi:hypothetical protein
MPLSQKVWDKNNKQKPNKKIKETVKQKQNDKRKYELINSLQQVAFCQCQQPCVFLSGNVSTDCQLHIDDSSDNSLHFWK